MTINPSDLPPEVRRGLLDQLRSQIGDSQYRELMNRADEDQVLSVLLKETQSRPTAPERPSPPGWLVIVAKLVVAGLLVGAAWLIGTAHWAGRSLAGAGAGLAFSIAFDMPGFAFGGVIGGAVGGAFGKKLDAAMGGVFIGGWAVVLIRGGVEWLAKQGANLNRY